MSMFVCKKQYLVDLFCSCEPVTSISKLDRKGRHLYKPVRINSYIMLILSIIFIAIYQSLNCSKFRRGGTELQ